MRINRAIHRVQARTVVATGLLTVTCAATGAGLGAGTSGAVQLTGYGSSSSRPSLPGAGTTAPGTGLAKYTFAISGKVSGLFPGGTLPLKLTITNQNTFAIKVTSVTVAVSNASSTCPASNMKVTSFSGSLSVGPKSTSQVSVNATLVHSASDACQGANFPLHYSGSATEG